MHLKRPVDELSIEELERVIALRKHELRLARLRHYDGRRLAAPCPEDTVLEDERPCPVPSVSEALPTEVDRPPLEDEIPHFEDELDDWRRGLRKSQGVSGKGWNRLLLLVEISAVLGLLFVFTGLFQSLKEVSETSARIQAEFQATASAGRVQPTATPLIKAAVVLPVGHKVKVNAQGVVVEASFNLDEVPAQYRDQYRALNAMPIVPPTPEPEGPAAVRIRIPRINVDSAVVEGDNWQALQLGVGHHTGSANPGERGNMVLSGHNDVYGEVFRHLDKLKRGDPVIVNTMTREYTYIVQEWQIVSPDAVWVLEARGNERRLTLISCYPYQIDTHRIVVFATLQT